MVSIACYSVPRKDVEGDLAAGSIDFAPDVNACRQLASKFARFVGFMLDQRIKMPDLWSQIAMLPGLPLRHRNGGYKVIVSQGLKRVNRL